MLCHLDQPGQDRIGIDLEHPGHGADAQAFRQRAHGPHQPLGRHALAMQWRAMGLLEVAATAGAMQLAPGAAAGMTIGRDIAQAEPAAIRTVGIGTEMSGGVDLAPASARRDEAWGRGTRGLTGRRNRLCTGVAVGLTDKTWEGCGRHGACAGWRHWRGWDRSSGCAL